jgi:L-malate glycosyltransferase
MKILRLYTRLPPLLGGMENHIAQLSKEQKKLGHDVTIYFNKGAKVTSNDVQITKFPFYKLKPQFVGIACFHFLAYLRLIMNREKFDIVHIHGDWSSLLFANFIKKSVGCKKLFMSIHDELSENKWSRKALSVMLNKVDIVFSTGHGLASQLSKLTSRKIVVQPSGIQSIFFNKYPRSFQKDSFQVIIVANLVEKKNLDVVLEIAMELINLNFLVVGDGPKKNHFVKRIKDLSLSNVQMMGYKNHKELFMLYYESDIFMLTSKKEGTPTAMLEAMACGLPVVTSNAGEVDSILGGYNFIAKVNNKKNFVGKLNELLEKKDYLEEVSNYNISVSKKYNWEYVAKNIDNFILDKN